MMTKPKKDNECGPWRSDEEVEAWEKSRGCLSGSGLVQDNIQGLKEHLSKKINQPKQKLFSFMPTSMTRTTPFYPINKRYLKDRPLETLEFKTSWGQLVLKGERLIIYDESVLLALLVLAAKHNSNVIQCTFHEICQIMEVKPGKSEYKAIRESILRLKRTSIDLYEFKDKKIQKALDLLMSGSILSNYAKVTATGKFQVIIDPYFLNMYAESLVTHINYRFRARIKGDIAKALYRFLAGQSGHSYSCGIVKLARALNIDIELPLFKIRDRLRTAARELKKQGYLSKFGINKQDTISFWKSDKPIKI